MAQAGTNFPKVRRMLFCVSPFILGYFLANFHAIPSLPETDTQILELWGYVDEDHLQIIPSDGFRSRMFA